MADFSLFNTFGQAAGYGSAGNESGPMAGVPVEDHTGGGSLLQRIQRKPFLTHRRRRLNVAPLLICVFLPWGLFVFDFWVSSFGVRYHSPLFFGGAIVISALVVLAFVGAAISARFKFFGKGDQRDPSWLTFLAISMVLALAMGYSRGDDNFAGFRRYTDYNNLNVYTDIHPDLMRGQQLLDAGVIEFAPGTRLNLSMSEGFKDGTIYCVAPITLGNATLPTYDFWAVGTNCCSGSQADYHCKGSWAEGYGGLRLMDSGARAKYRLAVQQAEATYGIKAAHPLFFVWTHDPAGEVAGWWRSARQNFLIWSCAALLFQTFLVASATLLFAKLGQL